MLTALEIHGFRCLQELRVAPLTRVNLFVGKNGSGKTSVLEAVEILATGRLERLIGGAVRRGEWIVANGGKPDEFAKYTVDPAHLFSGRSLAEGTQLEITGYQGESSAPLKVRCTVDSMVSHSANGEWPVPVFNLRFESHLQKPEIPERLRVSPSGGVLPPPGRSDSNGGPRVNFLATEGPNDLRPLWEAIALTTLEDELLAALRLLDRSVEDVGFFSEAGKTFMARLAAPDRRVPLGSQGAGLGRLLALSLHLLSAKSGVSLIDEIDTGLHYSVMTEMWRLVIETAKRHDVQVFATTHSLDCVRALAWLREDNPELAAEVTVHRLEQDRPKTVAFDLQEIEIAARSHLEVR